ncbi:unnamed protein product [Scytosiphon promiscuus]
MKFVFSFANSRVEPVFARVILFFLSQTPAFSRCLFVNLIFSFANSRVEPVFVRDLRFPFADSRVVPVLVRTSDSFASFRLDISVGISPFVRYLAITLPAVALPPSPRYARCWRFRLGLRLGIPFSCPFVLRNSRPCVLLSYHLLASTYLHQSP